MCVCTYICMYECMYVGMCVHMYMYVCMYVFIYVHVLCMYMYVRVHTRIYSRAYVLHNKQLSFQTIKKRTLCSNECHVSRKSSRMPLWARPPQFRQPYCSFCGLQGCCSIQNGLQLQELSLSRSCQLQKLFFHPPSHHTYFFRSHTTYNLFPCSGIFSEADTTDRTRLSGMT